MNDINLRMMSAVSSSQCLNSLINIQSTFSEIFIKSLLPLGSLKKLLKESHKKLLHFALQLKTLSFIDICYRDQTKIKFFFNDIDYENMYSGVKLKILWERCCSRLIEMQTKEYLI